jgi:5'-deoxynucleotidase YfbR-like HD superfamily hydrolase
MKEKLQFIMDGGCVVRYHTRPGIKPDTDAHHSHGVAMLCAILSGELPRAELLMSALTHDLGEQKASDMNANTKALLPAGCAEAIDAIERNVLAMYGLDYRQLLTDEESAILGLADLFDRLLWCCRELALGNKNSLLVWRASCTAIEATLDSAVVLDGHHLHASAVYEAIKEIHAEASGPGGPTFNVFRIQ